MRRLVLALSAVLAVVAGLLAAPVSSAAPSTASTSAAPVDACSRPQATERKKVYRFTNGDQTLGFGRVIVTPTLQNKHLYCVRFQTGGGKVRNSYSSAERRRDENGCGEALGGLGSGPQTTGAYNRTLLARKGICHYESFSIKSDGVWWTVSFMRFRLP